MATTQDKRQLIFNSPLGKDYLLIQDFQANEAISSLFSLELHLLHEENESGFNATVVSPERLIGQSVTLKMKQLDGTERQWNGMVVRFSQGQRDVRWSHYHALVVPRVWLLTQVSQSRIFQQKSVPDILKEVFKGFEVTWEIQGTFEPRNYCVQYGETDFNFASRLMEEEGIYYYFEHSDGSHKMIVANTPQSHHDCKSKKKLAFGLDVTKAKEGFVSAVSGWLIEHQLLTGTYTVWDSKFEMPSKKLDAEQPSRYNIGGNQDLEVFEYPGNYAKRFDGIDKSGGEQPAELQKIFTDNKRTVKIRQEEFDAQYKTVIGSSDCCSLNAGSRFELFSHPNGAQNGQNVLVSVKHEGVQSPEYISDETPERAYFNEFTCMPTGSATAAPFRPRQTTRKPVIYGGQTAFVVGPAGEEIFTDKYGRVKVQFHWDRDGKMDGNSSCWLRVGHSWAGKNWGMMFIPRIGMEVIVEFLEGDPDQPIITGCVYNAQAMPPYKLPDEKTKSTMKSDSSLGGGGFNEIRFEDKKGSEQIFVHGEKDVDVRNKNDRREWVGHDLHYIVKNDRREKIEKDTHLEVTQDQIEKIGRDHHLKVVGKEAKEVGGSLSLKVSGAVAENFGTSHSEEAGQTIYMKAGMSVVIEAGVQLTLKVGGNFVDISPAGVTIKGTMVLINSGGAAGSGSAGQLVPPTAPSAPDPADDNKPGSKIALEKRSAARKQRTFKETPSSSGGTFAESSPGQNPSPQKPQDKPKKSWVNIKLVDEAGNPVAGESYKVTLPDGKVSSGTLNEKGEAEVKGFEPGNCKITFPNLDKDAWKES